MAPPRQRSTSSLRSASPRCSRSTASTSGDYPSEEIEPTCEQLSTVDQLVRFGALPYVDFSLFGPHGKRAERKLSH
eukprot:2198370-Alexandrium_andersonii.AAC.1